MKNPTAAIVKKYIERNPLLGDYLSQGLINYSALARSLFPLVKQENSKAKMESILIAIQRNIPKKRNDISTNIKHILKTTEVSLTGDITEIVFDRTKETERVIFSRMEKRGDSGLCILNETRQEIALFISKHLLSLFDTIVGKRSVIENNLAVIGLHETKISKKFTSQNVPGYLAHLSLLFAQNNISIVELVSCHAQILIFLRESDASKGYELLRQHIKDI